MIRTYSRVLVPAILALLLVLGVPGALGSSEQVMCLGEPATIVGTEGDDWILGGDGKGHARDVFALLGGNDWVYGSFYDDVLCGGDGIDRIFVSGTQSVVDLTAGTGWEYTGTDTFEGFEEVDGGPGTDVLYGSEGADKLYGNGNNWNGDDLYGRGGNDTLESDSPLDYMDGGAGSDECLGPGTKINCER